MSKKKQSNKRTFDSFQGMVYSTNPDYMQDEDEEIETLPTNEQYLKVKLDSKHRGGKTVTLVTGFEGNDDDGKELCKKLKQKCGTGGSYKEGEIVIQGKVVDKVIEMLKKEGYNVK